LKPDLEAGGLGGRELLLMPGGGGYAMMNTSGYTRKRCSVCKKTYLEPNSAQVPLSRDSQRPQLLSKGFGGALRRCDAIAIAMATVVVWKKMDLMIALYDSL
jgi:hypothetical protein